MNETLRLHAEASRLAAAKPELLKRPEVVRSIEQEFVREIVNLISAAGTGDRLAANRRRSDTMLRFERALTNQRLSRHLPDLCASIGVPPRTLRSYCQAFIGRGPLEYMRLRRLNLARSALSQACCENITVAEIARMHGFSELGRFAHAYRALFGETPSATLQAKK